MDCNSAIDLGMGRFTFYHSPFAGTIKFLESGLLARQVSDSAGGAMGIASEPFGQLTNGILPRYASRTYPRVGESSSRYAMPLKTQRDASQAPGDCCAVWTVPSALRQLAESGEGDLVEELIADFQTDTASRLQRIGMALPAADLRTVCQEAHTIRGGALQIGANRLAALCHELESAAKQVPPVDLAGLFRSLLRNYEEVLAVVASRRGVALPGKPPAEATRPHGK